jgi:hypothetical protein
LGVFVVANAFTALSVAIPEIERDLSTLLTKAQWVINGYALVFVADAVGREKLPGWCRSGRIPFVVGSEAPERPMPRRHRCGTHC